MFILGGIFFGLAYATLSYQKTEHSMNNEYDVWFEGENAYELAANSDKLAYTRQSMRHLLNVGAEMELQEVVQHNFYGYRYIEPKINYNIQFANEQNEMISYRFSTLKHVKISYKNDI